MIGHILLLLLIILFIIKVVIEYSNYPRVTLNSYSLQYSEFTNTSYIVGYVTMHGKIDLAALTVVTTDGDTFIEYFFNCEDKLSQLFLIKINRKIEIKEIGVKNRD